MIELVIDETELRKALADIEQAKQQGFTHCLAVVRLLQVGACLDSCQLSYSDLVFRAHPTDPNLNWGRGGLISDYRFVDGRLVEDSGSSEDLMGL